MVSLTANKLQHFHMKAESRPYLDAMHAVLTHAGWTTLSKPMLAGMTVNGFRMAVHRRLTAESTTAYNWHAEHFLAADFIGVMCSSKAEFTFKRTFPLYRKQAIGDIRSSIDRGIAAICWHNGQFVAIVGYEDVEDGSGSGGTGNDSVRLFYADGWSDEVKPFNDRDFGVGEDRENPSPYWYYQIFEGCIPMDEAAVMKESFLQAIFKWETHDGTLPEKDYACGAAVYDAILQALRSGDYDQAGASETFRCMAVAKRDIAAYMSEAERRWPAAVEAAAHYYRVAELFTGIEAAAINQVDELCGLFQEAKQAETQAIEALRQLVRETVDNRFHDVGLR
ncbi:hypothetical protein DFQ01_12067 [Paenibacillus cellulosilyticus]|uniref:Butirosin biosynthesis protein H-like n=1 Tax=Paenibacillus cellulosilyticus TaxID=375489 RepID=A0A2V2YSH8_9BACL|nr:hypothetical protein [Paenibacillus cellulosilyticus]PWV97880.1 hypothetical protein DFQ01_12067 [Paenibacillus cellulosilyticus]QKS46949.1 hypothetical protein HUB94_20980 [Paenibacillus cellulosilyticus]